MVASAQVHATQIGQHVRLTKIIKKSHACQCLLSNLLHFSGMAHDPMCQIVFFGGKALKSKCAVLSVKQQACQINMCATNNNAECFGESHRQLGYFNVFMTLSFQKRSTPIDHETPWVQSVDSLNHGRHVWSQNPCLHTAPGASGTLQDKNCRVNLKKIGFYWRKPWFLKNHTYLKYMCVSTRWLRGLVPEIHELLCGRAHIFFQELGFAGFCFKITWLFKPQPGSMII